MQIKNAIDMLIIFSGQMLLRSSRIMKNLRSNLGIGPLLLTNQRNCLSSLHRLGIRFFCHSKQLQKMSSMEKQAIIAYYTMQYIENCNSQSYLSDSRTMRERIYCLEHLTRNLLQKAAKYQGKQIQNNEALSFKNDENDISEAYRRLQVAGFDKINIDKVLKAYDLTKGFKIDLQVWKQNRFLQALLPNGNMVLFPNQGTSLIFNKITKGRSQFIISGDKGSGKSFGYLNYEYLAGFITDYRRYLYENEQEPSQHLYNLVEKQKFTKIKKLYYFPLNYIDHALFLQQIFQRQTKFTNKYKLIGQKMEEVQRYKNLRLYLMELKVFLDLCLIDSVCVADEANIYLSAFRSVSYYMNAGKKSLQKSSELFNCLQHIFTAFIYNSSQQIDVQLFKIFNQSIRNKFNQKFHNPTQHNYEIKANGMHIRYNQFLSQKSGHIFLYSLFWDQLCKQLSEFELHKNIILKDLFCKLFGIPSKINGQKISTQFAILWWENDISHLNIRTAVDDSLMLLQLKGKLLQLKRQTAKKNQIYSSIAECFLKLQKEIMKNREKIFASSTSSYLQKCSCDVIKSFRFALMGHIASVKQAQQSLDQNKCPEIKVDFSKIIQNFQKRHNTINFLKQANQMFQLLGFGYPDKSLVNSDNKWKNITIQESLLTLRNKYIDNQQDYKNKSYSTKFRFLATDSSLNEIKSLIAENQDDVIIITENFLKLETLQATFAGMILDILYYRLFQATQMIFQVEQVINGQNEKKVFPIASTRPFNVPQQKKSQNQKFQQIFGQIISQAINNPNKMILGFQAQIVKTSQLYPKGYKICSKNSLFDFVIICFSNNQLIIDSFDTTVQQVHSKIGKFKKKKAQQILKRQIERINKHFDKKVIWKYHLLTFENNIKEYLSSNHYDHFQLMFLKSLEKPPNPQKLFYNSKKQNKEDDKEQQQPTKFIPLNQNIGKITLGLSMIPNSFHFTFPYNKNNNQQLLLSQMCLLSEKIDQLKNKQLKGKK